MSLAEFHDELRSVAREALSRPLDHAQLVELGWVGLEVPEALGGSGATFAETAVVLREMGRAAASVPFLGSVLAAGVLQEAGADELLTSLATGELRLAVVMSGNEELVLDAPGADAVLVVGDDALVAADAVVEERPVLDATRRFGAVRATSVREEWPLPTGAAARVLHRAAVAVALDSLGLAEAMVDATVEYAKVRHQFDRPIGSFQAVKHACADMLVAVTIGRELVTAAVDAVAGGGPEAWIAASQAKSYVTSAAVDVAGKAMQLHGGIGYTWECDVHVHLKRAALNRSLFGSPVEHRKRLASRYAV